MLKQLTLTNYKGFERFTVTFGPQGVLVGPNNAGKSTIIAALRAVSQMLSRARHNVAATTTPDGRPGWAFDADQVGLVAENLRHEFRSAPTMLQATFADGARVEAHWPVDPDADPLEAVGSFWVRNGEAVYLRRPAQVRALGSLTTIPALAPVEHNEVVLSDSHVRVNRSGRLTSRHFRNHLRLFAEQEDDGTTELERFLEWAEPWLPGLRIGELASRPAERGMEIDLFYSEGASRVEKELFWAGDGVQVWLQLLAHLYRAREDDTVVLDEPDLYLHADLQRRLVRLLESLDSQWIIASHSSEMIAEAPPSAVIWVDRERRRAVRAPNEAVLTSLSDAIGSNFNLRLARALRARGVVFVEGQDMRLLRNVARTLGLVRLVQESDLVVIPLQGFSNWNGVEPFSWLIDALLQHAVEVYVLLDRDYRTDSQVSEITGQLDQASVVNHIWRRKELESYLLEPELLARISGASVERIGQLLLEIADSLRNDVFNRMLAERLKADTAGDAHAVTVMDRHQEDFERLWADEASRHYRCNAKDVLRGLNRELQSQGFKSVSPRLLSHRMRSDEVPEEMRNVLDRLDQLGRKTR